MSFIHSHPIDLSQNKKDGYYCNLCAEIFEGKKSFECTSCDVDICSYCYDRYQNKLPPMTHAHGMSAVKNHIDSNSVCDSCGKSSTDVELIMFYCGDCKYRQCAKCFYED